MRHFLEAILLFAAAATASGQLTRGYVSGIVEDPSGAAVENVSVNITNTATRIQRSCLTNDLGVYRFAGVEPGVYTIEFAKSRFRTAQIEQIEVGSSQEKVLNHKLEIAEAAASVDVQATPPGVDLAKATPAVERSVGQIVLEGLPLVKGRDLTDLMALAPGSVRIPRQYELNYTLGGQRTLQLGFLVDGIDVKSYAFGFPLVNTIPESVAEYRVQTNAYSAEFGRSAGAIVSAISRSGANAFHGSVWDYHTANWLAAVTLADKRVGLSASRYQHHDAGGNLGGPLIRNRTFFFVLFNARPERLGAIAKYSQAIVVPTPAGYAALSRVPLRAGQSVESRQGVLDALAFLPQIYPRIARYQVVRPINVNGVPVETATVTVPITNALEWWDGETRVDHRLSGKDSVTFVFRAGHGGYDVGHTGGFALLSNTRFGNLFGSSAGFQNDSFSGSHTHAFSPRLINEFRFGWLRSDGEALPLSAPGPRLAIGGLFTAGVSNLVPWSSQTRNFEWQDVLSLQRGSHFLKAGGNITRTSRHEQTAEFTRGSWQFSNLADYLNNSPASFQQRFAPVDWLSEQTQQSYFFQDDCKVNKNLTLNLGIRYQTSNPPPARYGATTPELLAAGAFPPARRDANDWAPRIGLAWSPRVRTVVRGGFGIAYVMHYGANLSANYPRNATFSRSRADAIDLFPKIPPLPQAIPPLSPAAETFTLVSQDAQNPATHFYNFSVQQQIGKSYFVELGYMGNRGLHLQRNQELNPAILTPEQAQTVIAARNAAEIPGVPLRRLNPLWGARALVDYGASSRYDAAYVRFDRKLAGGLVVGANYTFSSTIDDGDGNPQDNYNFHRERGRAFIHRPHRFVVHYMWRAPAMTGWKRLLGAWQIGGYSEWQSGEPFTVITGIDSNGDGCCVDRPDYNPQGALRLDPVTGSWRSFSTPLSGGVFVTPLSSGGLPLSNSMPSGGNLGRNTLRSTAYANTNFNLVKRFAIGERCQAEFRADWSNFFNHRNFGPPIADMNNPAFGTNLSSPPSRETLLAVKIRF